MEFRFTEKAPRPAGHYSQAVVSGGLIYVSGQLPIHPDNGEIKPTIDTDQTGTE
jgi:2-iminobutanoate/2-iminopropanoate deaminase